MIRVLIIDCDPRCPQFDVLIHSHLPWPGWAIPGGRAYGEWVWVGRLS